MAIKPKEIKSTEKSARATEKTDIAKNGKKETKKPKKTPSERQKRAVKILAEKMVENGGKLSKGEILKEAGYSDAIAKNPAKIFESASMKKAIKSAGLDLKSLKMKHKQLLNMGRLQNISASIHIPHDQFVNMVLEGIPWSRFMHYFDNALNASREYFFIIPDTVTQTKALEMQYKILGEFAPEKHRIVDRDDNDIIIFIPDNGRN